MKKLITDSKSVFYAVDKTSKSLLNKARKWFYPKHEVFTKLYKDLNDKDILYTDDKNNAKLPFYTSFVEKKNRLSNSVWHQRTF